MLHSTEGATMVPAARSLAGHKLTHGMACGSVATRQQQQQRHSVMMSVATLLDRMLQLLKIAAEVLHVKANPL